MSTTRGATPDEPTSMLGTHLTLDQAMRRALALAARGPAGGANPQVGAVILAASPDRGEFRDGSDSAPVLPVAEHPAGRAEPTYRVLGEGWHRGAGTAHAEVDALASAAAAGNDVRGATAVVTLQPCNATGRTGPCTQALIAAGIARVRFSATDPLAEAAGSTAALEAAGIEVHPGLLETEGTELLHPWLTSVALGRPYVTLKLATSLDGRIAAADGTSRWITGPASRAHAHAVRSTVGAIAVGTGTVATDDPTLTARTSDGDLAEHQPLRVVVGERHVPHDARLRGRGGDLVHLPTHDVAQVLADLSARGVRHLLVEGGPTLTTAFLAAGVVDEVHAYLAPVALGAGLSAVGDFGVGTIADAARWRTHRVERLADDVLLVARSVPAGTARSAPAHTARSAQTGTSRNIRTGTADHGASSHHASAQHDPHGED